MKFSSPLLDKLDLLTDKIVSYEISRASNLKQLEKLFPLCVLDDSFHTIHELFEFKAMNLMGISLKEESLGMIQTGRYIQLLVITTKKKEDKKSRNISLSYFGKSETVEKEQVARLTEFVLRWRYEKSFLNVNHYKSMIEQLDHDVL